jgi:hypothetical protein
MGAGMSTAINPAAGDLFVTQSAQTRTGAATLLLGFRDFKST